MHKERAGSKSNHTKGASVGEEDPREVANLDDKFFRFGSSGEEL